MLVFGLMFAIGNALLLDWPGLVLAGALAIAGLVWLRVLRGRARL